MINLLTHKWICVLPLIVLLVFATFYIMVQLGFAECSTLLVHCDKINVETLLPVINPVAPIPNPSDLAKQYSGRMIWLFVSSTYVLACLFAIGIFGLIAARWLGRPSSIALVAVAFAIGCLVAGIDRLPLIAPLLERTIELSNYAGIRGFVFINRLIHLIGITATMAMVFVVCAILFGDDEITKGKRKSSTQNDSIDLLTEKRNHLKLVLYSATVLLIIGVLRADQGSSWAITFISNEASAESIRAFFRTVTATLGGFYTLLLAAVYIPAAFIIHERARAELKRKHNALNAAELTSKLDESGFKFSFAEALPRILAIAAPLLAGPVADLLKGIASNVPNQ